MLASAGFTPAQGAQLSFMTYTSRTNWFATITLNNNAWMNGGNRSFSVERNDGFGDAWLEVN